MKGLCPICNMKYKIKSIEARKIRMLAQYKWKYDPQEGDTLHWPCEKHKDKFMEILDKVSKVRDEAWKQYNIIVHKTLSAIKREALTHARNVLRRERSKLLDGEGLIFWVSTGGRKLGDTETKDIAVAVIRRGKKLETVYGSANPVPSYKEGEAYATTHYTAQNLLDIMNSYPEIRWKGIIQGMMVSGDTLKNLLWGVFMVTHREPKASLVDILSDPGVGPGSAEIREIKGKSMMVDGLLYSLVEPVIIERSTAEQVERDYGVPPVGPIRPKHLRRYLEEEVRETVKTEA